MSMNCRFLTHAATGLLALSALLAPPAIDAADPAPAAVSPKSPPTSIWARNEGIRDLKLSPDGKRIAVRYHDPEGARVAILSVPDLKPLGAIRLDRWKSIVDVHWMSNDQLVAEIGREVGPVESAAPTGELFAFSYTGKNAELLSVDRQRAIYATIVDPLPAGSPGNILIMTERYDRARSYQSLQRFTPASGRLVELAMAPEYGASHFVLDAKGEVRYVTVHLEGAIFKAKSWRREADGVWTPVPQPTGLTVRPAALSKDGSLLYRLTNRDGGPWCLDRQTLATGAVESLVCNPMYSISNLVLAFDGSDEPIAAVLEPGRSETRVFASGHPDRELLTEVLDAFPGKRVGVQSITADGRTVLLRVGDDRSPGDWYLFDTVAKKVDYLLGQQEWLDPEWMGERRPLTIKARDGTSLQAYLTLPPGLPEKNLPLVVWPHGGPLGVRDHWAFDLEPQLLATHGYAVLQVNFRGSDGHGPAFIRQGARAWGTTIIDDITDSVRATIASGAVDGGRVCIGGWSYGGYAALMSAVREPDLYRCVIGAAGVYDVAKDRDTMSSWQVRRAYDETIADDAATMREMSPIHRLEALKAPVLIIHGGEDERVRVTQAKLLRAALDKRQLPYETLIIDEEGHGFRKEANVQRYYDKLLAFLAKHLPPPAE